jgi:nitroimidazol reductase NimA-like FMN-containing flavoprotein (pyridoxamine 5'-phosphate oxidase superfamily)
MRPDAEKILKETDLCVLCTSRDDVPDASLMLYTTDDACTGLYMVTRENTEKYRNIVKNPSVSVLVDTRGAAADASWTKAMTISGEARVVNDPAMSREWIARLTARHPQVSGLARDAGARVIEVRMTRILFLDSADAGGDVAL